MAAAAMVAAAAVAVVAATAEVAAVAVVAAAARAGGRVAVREGTECLCLDTHSIDDRRSAGERIQLSPGGNRIISFLDVVAPDEMHNVELQQRLASLKHWLGHPGNPTIAYLDPLWVRFGSALPVPRTTEIGVLAGHMVLSLSGAKSQAARSR